MNCNTIQTLLLTDYNDGVLSQQKKAAVENHIRSCSVCQEFVQTLNRAAIEPFKKVKPQQPPSHLWQRIRETIETESQPHSRTIFDTVKDFLSGFLPLPRPAFAFALTTIVIVSIVLFRLLSLTDPTRTDTFIEDQVESFLYLSEGDGFDFGTGIEEYFL